MPYIAHLLSVSSRVLSAGGSEVQAIAGLLHDAAEDQGGQATLDEIRRLFGDGVAEIVADCTDSWAEQKPEWRPRKEAYLTQLPYKPASSLLVSLADKVDNAEAIARDLDEVGEMGWQRCTGKKDGTIWYYRSLSRISMKPCLERWRGNSRGPSALFRPEQTGEGARPLTRFGDDNLRWIGHRPGRDHRRHSSLRSLDHRSSMAAGRLRSQGLGSVFYCR
ncbi:HD domain-containing protein [Bradyrhizobium sp. HKCCYLRH2060]|uniref:HD domain-containing protein n=1 Tax=Bradyrhizobium TaxID=374 RepID=UPI002915F234|nr:HD domain-containing protein [Bradyrhizobium sp. SZCCHNR3003]